MYTVYMTFNNLEPTKCYVGMTSGNNHNYKGSGLYINNAIKKYGKKNFTRCDLGHYDNYNECHYWEGFYIKTLKTLVEEGGYNLSPTGGITGGGIVAEESKQKMRDNHYDCNGENNGMYKRGHRKESKELISKNTIKAMERPEVIAKLSHTPWNKGLKLTEEDKQHKRHPHQTPPKRIRKRN